jgi:hypothetical protein
MREIKFQMGDKVVRMTTPPIHQHYDPETDLAKLCGHVFCPHGFVGIEVIGNIYENPERLEARDDQGRKGGRPKEGVAR